MGKKNDKRRSLAILFIISVILILLLGLITALAYAQSGATDRGEINGYKFKYYVPTSYNPDTPAPLVVVLHGCLENAAKIEKDTRFDELAETEGFVVLYPETGPSPVNPMACWVFWHPENQQRGRGEPQIIMNMVDHVKKKVNIDPTRIYATGISSGASMSVILGSLYPDVFAAVAAHSGLEFAAGTTATCGMNAMGNGGPNPDNRGKLAYYSQGTQHRMMPMLVFQGTDDSQVSPLNADQILTQFAQMNDYADDGQDNDTIQATTPTTETGQVTGGYHYTAYNYQNRAGQSLLQKVLVDGLGHAWSGGVEGVFSDPKGPDATAMMWTFFKQWSLVKPPLNTAPAPACVETFGPNSWHYYGPHRRMSEQEYMCDSKSWTWRHTFDNRDSDSAVWGGGRCPALNGDTFGG